MKTLKELAVKYNWSPEELERQKLLKGDVHPSGVRRMVKDLKVGDVLTSGDTVIEAPFDSVHCPAGKCNIGIQYISGIRKVQQWNKRTEVGIKEAHVYRDPGMPRQQPNPSPDFDYWGMSRL